MSNNQITIAKGGKVVVNGREFASVQEALDTLANESKPKAITAKVSQRGALSIYGLQRLPVTLYKSQWQRLLSAWDPEWLNIPGLAEKGDAPRIPPTAAKPAVTLLEEIEESGYDSDEPEPTEDELIAALLARKAARKAKA